MPANNEGQQGLFSAHPSSANVSVVDSCWYCNTYGCIIHRATSHRHGILANMWLWELGKLQIRNSVALRSQ
ncbi:hypothetical protein SERLA73DRAFT_179337 [Serpula lacrymans var. lacrymans S7.3]|uniref:Uncharacterized protein n=2 Tax=Serpula lacrymans var. lacrymans TaxID=341189 RepID=F8PS37_SERL3|nr:uncharacterized protein SERLADRAFT_464420 [Serpula lacrymans var. lacrymans S7.9]EGO01219.1 hypothetical protein SERLA73DRAFT_179337 [Serpula lacrymans var. lacrymans S7.3]EGO26868.1 hypothetical protein SERLADRAFT_464420 [Serpula lacrymans var. lacrymans S7.9]